MYSFGDEDQAMSVICNLSKVIDGEIYVPAAIIEEINEAFAALLIEDHERGEENQGSWSSGALSVMSLYKTLTDGLLKHFAGDIVPDSIPDNFVA